MFIVINRIIYLHIIRNFYYLLTNVYYYKIYHNISNFHSIFIHINSEYFIEKLKSNKQRQLFHKIYEINTTFCYERNKNA
jgi:hypothetical protein